MYILEYDAQRTMDIVYEDGYLKGQEKGRVEGKAEGRAEGKAEGREEGRAEGKAEGREEERITVLKSLMANLSVSVDEAMRLLNIPISDRYRYL